MSLQRIWIPTGNKGGRPAPRLLVIHTTEGFTGPNGMYDCGYYFQGPVGASSHVVVDNFHPGAIVECVSRSFSSWTQCGYNVQTAGSIEQCGYASWSRDTWLTQKEPMLRNTAAWLAEEAAALGVPLTKLSPGQAQGSARGVCYHSDLGSAGCGHSDPGAGYPIDVVLDWARGGSPPTPIPPTPPKEEEDMPYLEMPPLGGAPAVAADMSLDGMFSTMGICTDASTRPSSSGVRVAFHIGPRRWVPANVWSDNGGDQGHEKVVYAPKDSAGKPLKFDGVSVTRLDTNNTRLVLNFGR